MTITGCGIFREELEHLQPNLPHEVRWVSPGLHTDLDRLGEELRAEAEGDPGSAFLFGAACHPDLPSLAASRGGEYLPGKDCVAAFLSEEERRALEARKAFVITPGWLRHWREIFQEGLHWDEVDARQNFGFYDSIVLLDFGLEPIDDLQVLEFFEYTQTPIEIVPATLDRFRDQIENLTAPPHGD
ncbi:MAG: DUF1638 domain-containing protein [Deferrisomatales bacterium]|nr:DUF1638 domain-containing protein [Deferrisomatales bacterium]